MNNVLELKGKRFVQESKKGNGGGAAINSKVVVTNNQPQYQGFWRASAYPLAASCGVAADCL